MNTSFKISLVILTAALLSLSSCMIGKKYERPAVQTEDLFRTNDIQRNQGITVGDDRSMGEVSWRRMFTDTILQNYIEQALTNNLDMRLAIKSIDVAAAYLRQSKSALEPVADASLNYGVAHNPKYTGQGAVSNQFRLGADLSWEADIWGKIRSQQRATEAAYLQTLEAQNVVKTKLISGLAALYYRIIALDEQIKIAELSALTRDSSLQTTRSLMQAGQVTAVAIQQTQALVYDAQNIVLNLQNQRRILENAFCLLLSEPSHPIRRSGIDDQAIQTSLALGVPAQLLANRPDVRMAEYDMIRALEMTNIAEANFYPSLVITASGGFSDVDIKSWLTPDGIFAQVAGGLLQPIINRKQLKTAHEVALNQEEMAFLRYQQMLLLAGNEVSDALFDYQTQNEVIALQEQQYQTLRTAVDYSQQLLLNGLANYLEVLTAQQNVLIAQLNLADAKYERLASIIQLYEALGGGWQ